MLILHVRQSEVALADGRLDEAYAVATAHDVGRHHRGQRLITRLVDALVRRGQAHAAAQRYAAALADCEKAAKLGGNLPDVVALRAAATDAVAQLNRQQQRQALALATARRHVDDGDLSLGERLLAAAPADASRAALLRDDIDHRRRTAADAVRACGQAFKGGDVDRAARELLRARASDPHQPDLADLAPRVKSAVVAQLQEAVETGHLDRADDLLRHLCALDPACPDARRQQALLDALRGAWQQVQSGAFADARVAVTRLLPMTDDAPWLKRTAEQLRQAEQALTDLKVGPLAWLGQAAPRGAVAAPAPARRIEPQPHTMPQRSDILPTQFVLHVDGVGSFLVLRQPVVTIGPISAPVAADVAVVAEPTLAPVTIARLDDDYFIKGLAPAAASAPAGRLLASGEPLELSPRCRLTFRVPSPASTTAVLDLTGARLPRGDVRRVILMDQDLIIGATSAAHVVAPRLERPVVLHVRHGRLVCPGRDGGGGFGGGGDSLALPVGESVSVGGVSFVVGAVDSRGGSR